MPILASRRTGAALCIAFATSILTVALACSDSLAPHTPRGSGGPRFLYQDPALESPPSASGSIDLPPLATSVNGMSTVVGHFPYGTVVRFDVSGSHILSSVTGRDGSGSYGLQGRSCQTGDVGTTSFAGANTGWDACNAPIGSTQTNYSDYISVVGDVYLYHAGDGGSTPPYPDCTHDCFYIGGGSQLTLTRIEASLDLTTSDAPAQSSGVYVVSPGTSLTFGWAVSPASVSSAGGDIKLGAVTNSSSWEITRPAGNVVGCPYFPFASGNNYRYCQVRADSALTVKLTAITNGAWKSKSVQIIPRRNFRLQGPTSAEVGDTIAYTATLDGQAIRATRWVWMPSDTSTHETSNGWDHPTSTSRLKSMATSGKMTAYIDYAGGGTDSASVTTTVSDKFTLTASASNVAYGDSVTFTPLLDGAPTLVSRWKYVPADTGSRDSTACAGQTSMCVKRMQRSGTMWAWLASDSSRSATASVTVDAGCVPGPTFSKSGTSALSLGAPAARSGRRATTPKSLHVGVENRDVICGGDAAGAGGSDSSRYAVLHLNLPAGISGRPGVPDSLYHIGDTVHYAYTANPGYTGLVLALDDTIGPDSGTIVMNADREIEVGIDPDYAANTELAQYRTQLRALLSASDKPAAFANLLSWYAGKFATDGATRVDSLATLASDIELDPVADASQLRALDDALAGYVFSTSFSTSGVSISYRAPADYQGGVLTSRARGNVQLRLNRTLSPRAGSPRRTLATTPGYKTELITINGINVGLDASRQASIRFNQVIAAYPAFQDSTGKPTAALQFDYFYNRTLSAQLAAYDSSTNHCGGMYVRDRGFRSKLASAIHWAACKGVRFKKYALESDLAESAFQFLNLEFGINTPEPDDVYNLDNFLRALHNSSTHTILVTHSQGNMLAGQAIANLVATEGVPLQSHACTAVLSLAAPIHNTSFGLDGAHLRGRTIEHDILLYVGLPNDFNPYQTNERSREASAEIDATSNTAEKLILGALWGKEIHSVVPNYFEDPDIRGYVFSDLLDLSDACNTASYTP